MQDKNQVGKAEYNSELIVDELKALGIEYVSLNPMATTRGIHDSIVTTRTTRNQA